MQGTRTTTARRQTARRERFFPFLRVAEKTYLTPPARTIPTLRLVAHGGTAFLVRKIFVATIAVMLAACGRPATRLQHARDLALAGHHKTALLEARAILLTLRDQQGEKVVGATRAPEEREAEAAAEEAPDHAGNEDDEGSPPDGET